MACIGNVGQQPTMLPHKPEDANGFRRTLSNLVACVVESKHQVAQPKTKVEIFGFPVAVEGEDDPAKQCQGPEGSNSIPCYSRRRIPVAGLLPRLR